MVPNSPHSTRLVVVMVGLPARGKTYIARKLSRFLSWLGYRTRVFNIGDYRRARLGSRHRHEFFDPTNAAGNRARREMAELALGDLLAWMAADGEVAIYDATNSTRARRSSVGDRCRAAGLQVVFIESACEDPGIIEANIRETKLSSPDYADMDPDEATADFRARIAHYASVYEPLSDADAVHASTIKLIDVGRVVVVQRLDGYLSAKILFYLLNLHVVRRPIYLTRHGESTLNQEGRIGGDAPLSPRGQQYAEALARFVATLQPPPAVFTSTLQRTMATAAPLPAVATPWRALDEIDAGVCDGMTYAEIAAAMPAEYEARQRDKLRYRYPRGESYEDVIARLEPVIIEMERQRQPLMIVAHQAVLRALYAYFMDREPADVLRLEIPLHTVICLAPGPYAFVETRHALQLT